MDSVVITGGAVLLENIEDAILKTTQFPIKKIGEIDYANLIGSRGLKYLTKATKMSLAASILAKEHAGLQDITPERGGVTLATNLASIYHVTDFDITTLTEGVNHVSPMQGPNLLLNAPSSRLGIFHQLSGFNTTITSGRVGAFDALEYAYNSIKKDEVDICFVGGVEEKSQEYLNWFMSMGLVDENQLGKITQGAGIVILESQKHAEEREATIYGEICNFSSIFDTEAMTENNNIDRIGINYKYLIEGLFQNNEVDVNSVCIADNQLQNNTTLERQVIADYFSKAEIKKHFQAFGGELYSCSGIVQLISMLNDKSIGYNVAFNNDWFGNYRGLLTRKGANK